MTPEAVQAPVTTAAITAMTGILTIRGIRTIPGIRTIQAGIPIGDDLIYKGPEILLRVFFCDLRKCLAVCMIKRGAVSGPAYEEETDYERSRK